MLRTVAAMVVRKMLWILSQWLFRTRGVVTNRYDSSSLRMLQLRTLNLWSSGKTCCCRDDYLRTAVAMDISRWKFIMLRTLNYDQSPSGSLFFWTRTRILITLLIFSRNIFLCLHLVISLEIRISPFPLICIGTSTPSAIVAIILLIIRL